MMEMHEERLMGARRVLGECLDLPELAAQVANGDDLLAAGVNSGEIIRVALCCEEHLGRALSDEELASITSIESIAVLLRGKD